MILRRFMLHVKEQNWFAVGLDVIVVIVGIFMGLQVQAWYEARGDRDQEAKYLAQLHDEVAEIELRYAGYIRTIDERVEILQNIITIYRENGAFGEFGHADCNVILVSHIYTNFISPVTTINELETSGRSQIIQSDEIRKHMVQHKMNEGFSNMFTSNLQPRGIDFPIKYPEFIELNIATTISSGLALSADVGNRCEVPTPDKNIGFKNSLVANAGRYAAYNGTVKRQFTSLSDLHSALDQELGIIHDEGAQ